MAFNFKRNLIIFVTLMAIMQITKGQGEPHTESDGEDDSSSEETTEDSNESRRPRSVDISMEGADGVEGQAKAGLPAIPGLPDSETILKIADILTTVGQQVLPILVSGNSGVADFVTNPVRHDTKFLKKFKKELKMLSEKLLKNK